MCAKAAPAQVWFDVAIVWRWAGLQADYDLRLARYQTEKETERDVEPLAALHPALA